VTAPHDHDEPATGTGGGLVRLRFDIAYDGTALSGWARQPGRRTVQEDLETALAVVLRSPVRLTVAGRTDAGVHATGQVAQITYHLNRAMDNGLTGEEAGEVLGHLAFYAGWPNAFSAAPVVKDVIEKRPR